MNNQNPPPIQRVVELDDKRVNHIQGLVEDLKEMVLSVRGDAARRDEAIQRLEKSNTKIDEAIRGNGKEGLNQKVARLTEKMDEIPKLIEDKVDIASMAMNTAQVRTIVQEELDKRNAAPGSWGEFRQKWLIPISISSIMTVIGILLGMLIKQ